MKRPNLPVEKHHIRKSSLFSDEDSEAAVIAVRNIIFYLDGTPSHPRIVKEKLHPANPLLGLVNTKMSPKKVSPLKKV